MHGICVAAAASQRPLGIRCCENWRDGQTYPTRTIKERSKDRRIRNIGKKNISVCATPPLRLRGGGWEFARVVTAVAAFAAPPCGLLRSAERTPRRRYAVVAMLLLL